MQAKPSAVSSKQHSFYISESDVQLGQTIRAHTYDKRMWYNLWHSFGISKNYSISLAIIVFLPM